jgi:hypothetical protein
MMPVPELLTVALARPDLPPTLRAFLSDVHRAARCGPLTPRQMAAVERIARAEPSPDFAAINRAAAQRAEDVCRRLLPGGAPHGSYWAAGDLSGAAGKSLRVRLAGERAGAWIDNATGDKGGDFVSLAAAVARMSQAEAARSLARMLGMEAGR